MLLTKMDLLNYQYLDKMNNNIGILCYEGKVEWRVCAALFLNSVNAVSYRPRLCPSFTELTSA